MTMNSPKLCKDSGRQMRLWRSRTDSEGDLVPDCNAQRLKDSNKSFPGSCGGGEAEIVCDNDGFPDHI